MGLLSIGIKRRVSIFSESQYTNISYRHVWNTFQLILLLRCEREREGASKYQNINMENRYQSDTEMSEIGLCLSLNTNT